MESEPPGAPLISVVMPVYNAEPFLAESIRSILTQTHRHLELIILVDEGSTDGSAAVAREPAQYDSRIRAIDLPHSGRSRARNIGAAAARGEWLVWQDADDVALPERLESQLNFARGNRLDICGCCAKTFGDQDGLLWFPETHDAIRAEMFFRIGLLLATVMMRTEIARAHPFDEAVVYEEYEWYARLLPRYRFGNAPQILLKERSHASQSHIREADLFERDQRMYRRPYFFQLYPEAKQEDYAALAGVADKEACTHLGDLRRAGEWLARLPQVDDAFLRDSMARRWLGACRRSARIGPGVYRLYRELLPSFQVSRTARTEGLWFACALRIAPGSRLHAASALLWRGLKKLRGVLPRCG